MIALALVMIRRRLGHALTVFLLATIAIAAAVAAPVYVRVAQRSLASVEIAAATPAERTIVGVTLAQVQADPGDPRSENALAEARRHPFDKTATTAARTPGFTMVFAANFIAGASTTRDALQDIAPEQRLEFRDGFCGYVVITVGRCVAGPGEVIVGERQAAGLGVTPGRPLWVVSMIFVPPTPDSVGAYRPAGLPASLSVVGIYRPQDEADLFWGNVTGATSGAGPPQPLLVDRRTLGTVDHHRETESVVVYPSPGTLDPDHLDRVRAELNATSARMVAAGVSPQTSMDELLDRIAEGRRQVATTPAVAAVPLILLCCFVVFLAAASTTQARRVELGMLKLRGTGQLDRWWLACAEVVLPVLAGGIVGYLVGHVAVWVFGRLTLSSRPDVAVTTQALPHALVALAAALVAGLLALRGDLARPALDLLRRVPARTQRWGGTVLRTTSVVLATAAVFQLRSAEGRFTGLALIAPAMVILAVALVSATAFDRVAQWWGRRALRRGRLGVALGALHLGRRRAGSRVLALLVVAVGMVGFAATASEIGTVARTRQVEAYLGADRVLQVRPTSARQLLEAVRTVDPAGQFAMAVMSMRTRTDNLPVLAVDTTRLATASRWPGGGNALNVGTAMSQARPALADPVIVRGTGVELTANLTAQGLIDGDERFGLLSVTVSLARLDGGPPAFAVFTFVKRGTETFRAPVGCEAGCRVINITVQPYYGQPMTVTLMALRQTGPAAELVDASGFTQWQDRQAAEITLAPTERGLAVTADGSRGASDGKVGPADVPDDGLPGLVAGSSLSSLVLIAPNTPTGLVVRRVRAVSELPRVGTTGVLIDLEYVARLSEPGPVQAGEVWLGRTAPDDVTDRLRGAGLAILGDRRLDTELLVSRDRPNAVGLRFLLAVGVLCLLLGAGGLAVTARIERRARADELRALRAQGLPRRMVARAGRISYLALVITAGVFGAGAAAAAWLATGERMPLVDVLVPGLATPRWPSRLTLWALAAAVAVLIVAAVFSGFALTRAARTANNRRSAT
ncbi:MAG: ABC transporter permease [Micromonosporaceae bacterium]